MKRGHAHPEAPQIAAHLVLRQQPVVAVERGVLHALGHDRTGVLLEAHRQVHDAGALGFGARAGEVGREHAAQKDKDAALGGQRAPPRGADRLIDEATVLLRCSARGDIGAVDRKARDHVGQRGPQAAVGEVAGRAIGLGNARQRPRQRVELARHLDQHDQPLRAIKHIFEVGPLAQEREITARELRLGACVDE